MAGQEEGRGWVGWRSGRVHVGVGGWNGFVRGGARWARGWVRVRVG